MSYRLRGNEKTDCNVGKSWQFELDRITDHQRASRKYDRWLASESQHFCGRQVDSAASCTHCYLRCTDG